MNISSDIAAIRLPKDPMEQALWEIERLRAENESLRKDAERYRWLREADIFSYGKPLIAVTNSEYSSTYMNGDDADEAIDRAMKG